MTIISPTSPLMAAPHPAGLYRISFYIKTTVASAGASMTINITYADGTSRSIQVETHDLATLNAISQGTLVGYSEGTQNVGFTVQFTNRGSSQFVAWGAVEPL